MAPSLFLTRRKSMFFSHLNTLLLSYKKSCVVMEIHEILPIYNIYNLERNYLSIGLNGHLSIRTRQEC